MIKAAALVLTALLLPLAVVSAQQAADTKVWAGRLWRSSIASYRNTGRLSGRR
jgi:hypothetical protein